MCPANKKSASGSALRASVEGGEWIGAARLRGLALRASVGSGKSPFHSPLPTLSSLLLAIIFFYTPISLAERADRDKPIHLEADQVRIDDAQQISTFTGNVKLSQGTLLIRGDKIVVTQDKDGFKHGTAYGNTASFRQKREGLDEYVEGYGERIEYDARAETVDFYVRARLKRELDEVLGEHIPCSAKTDIFQVNGGASTDSSPPKRVRAVLQPRPQEKAALPPAPDGLRITPSETLTPQP